MLPKFILLREVSVISFGPKPLIRSLAPEKENCKIDFQVHEKSIYLTKGKSSIIFTSIGAAG